MISIAVSGATEVRRRSFANIRFSTTAVVENLMREDDMRARLILQMLNDDSEIVATQTVADLVKVTKRPEDLGLSLSEAKTLLAKLQQVMVATQVESWLSEYRDRDGRRLRSKGSYPVTFHTLFGDVRLKSPRYYLPRVDGANSPATISPLRELIPDHIAPERLYLETRWASLVPYAAAAELLADVLPIDCGANATTVRQHALRTARRIEQELTEERVSFMQDACPHDWCHIPANTAIDTWRNLFDSSCTNIPLLPFRDLHAPPQFGIFNADTVSEHYGSGGSHARHGVATSSRSASHTVAAGRKRFANRSVGAVWHAQKRHEICCHAQRHTERTGSDPFPRRSRLPRRG
jgi:hypothetical protein